MNDKKFIYMTIVVVIVAGIIWYATSSSNKSDDTITTEIENQIIDESEGVIKNASQTQKSTNITTPTKTVSRPLITEDGIYVVYYGNSGFYPNMVNVKAGKTVRFTNESDKAMLIFTDSIYSKYSALNQLRSLGKGGVYDFTFTDIGLWEYYNKNNPTDRASITVY